MTTQSHLAKLMTVGFQTLETEYSDAPLREADRALHSGGTQNQYGIARLLQGSPVRDFDGPAVIAMQIHSSRQHKYRRQAPAGCLHD